MRGRLWLYNFLITVLGIVALPWIVYQFFFVPKRKTGFSERLGSSPVMEEKSIWCHAVSVGEVKAVVPLLVLLEDDPLTGGRIVLSTVTVTGQETAGRECTFAARIFYFPLDLPFVVGRAVRRVNPEVFITAETEIWPNFFSACFKKNIPVVIVNGRISDSSFTRYRRFRWFFSPILQKVSLFLMQSEEDARRVLDLGAEPETVLVTGNMKYDRIPEPTPLPGGILEWAAGGFLLVAGSTHAGEERVMLDSLQGIRDADILLALVPRHPERFEDVAQLLGERGITFTRYTEVLKGGPVDGKVVLVDAMGVLDGFYALADVAFVGGSLVPVGGHNLLEPAMHGVPVLTGPHLHNFRDIAEALATSGGCLEVSDTGELARALEMLRREQGNRDEMGRMAAAVSKRTKGASFENAGNIISLIENRTSGGQN